jgi:RNA-binding protein 39
LNGFELAKRPIRVGLGNDRFTDNSTKSLLQASSQQFQGSDFSGAGGRGAYAGGSGNFDRAAREADKTGAGSALDDSDVGGVNMSNYNRYELIRKLARTENDEVKAPTQTITHKPVDQPQTATRCVVLRHLYDPAT